MRIRELRPDGARHVEEDGLAAALAGDHLVWVDLPLGDPGTERVLGEVFCFHEQAVRDCLVRNSAAKLHVYEDHTFLVLHVPDPGEGGHVHSIELDLFVGPDYVVTVHGPVNPAVPAEVAHLETDHVAARVDAGRFAPGGPAELVHAIVTGLNRRMNRHLAALRLETWDLERRVTSGALGDPEDFLEEMFRVRLALQAIRTMAALDGQVYGRVLRLDAQGTSAFAGLVHDSLDQFDRVVASSQIQTEYLQGVIDFYQTRINTKMTVAAERLAVIAAVTLPVTAVSSIVGMNVIVNASTHWSTLLVLLALMAVMSATLLVWARRQGWW